MAHPSRTLGLPGSARGVMVPLPHLSGCGFFESPSREGRAPGPSPWKATMPGPSVGPTRGKIRIESAVSREWDAMRIGQIRAAWLIVAGSGFVAIAACPLRAGEGDKPATPVVNTVRLEIQIAGLGAEGAKISVKPAHPGCRFKAEERKIPKGAGADIVKVPPFSVAASTTSADRDCSFEITITEPGHEPRKFRRGLRLNPPADGEITAPVRTLKCYLATTAVAIKDDGKTTPRR